MFSCEFCEVLINTYFEECLRTAASVDSFLEVIKSRIFKGLKLTLSNWDFLSYSGPGRGADTALLVKSVTVLLICKNLIGIYANVKKSGKHTFPAVTCFILLTSASSVQESQYFRKFPFGTPFTKSKLKNASTV